MSAPDAAVAGVAPATLIWAPGGTRRRATIEGVPLDERYIAWARGHLVENVALFFRLGVQHLIVPILGPRQMAEEGLYGERLIAWIGGALAGPLACAEYQQRGWRARMIGQAASLPALTETAAQMAAATPDGAHTLWFYAVTDDDDPWREVLATAGRTGARTQREAVRALYGEDVPPATLLIGFGKPVVGTTLLPPLLTADDMQCYWTQRAGFRLTEPMLRTIIYDYAYARRTWRPDRQGRYADAPGLAALWEREDVLGVGTRLGGYWYPTPFPASRDDEPIRQRGHGC